MSETTTQPPAPIHPDLSLPLEQRLLKRSVKLRQADQANIQADQWAGLAMNRKSVEQYHQQTHKATEAMVNRWVRHQDNQCKGEAVPAEDDQAINTDLSERYEQHTHYHNYPQPPAAQSNVAAAAAGAAPSLIAKALPYLATGGAGAALMAGVAWLGGLVGGDDPAAPPVGGDVSHKLESEYEVRFFDSAGNPISIPHISKIETQQ